MPYSRFLPANIVGGALWTVGTTYAIYALGLAAETWLKRFSWAGLVVALLVGAMVGWMVKRRVAGALETVPPATPEEDAPAA
jgi:membrane protein DedA with SNARE-associated domain